MSDWFKLTGQPVLMIAVVLAVVTPVVVVVLWSRARGRGATLQRRVLDVAGRVVVVVLAQVLAMFALFLYVNNDYGFFSSWSDLFGTQDAFPQRVNPASVDSGAGKTEVLAVRNSQGILDDVLVWLPPGYEQLTNLPVLMFLPGQPSQPDKVFAHFAFGAVASAEIKAGRVRPFIGVFPPIMIAPPRDTECVDVPGGPQAETWLTSTVPAAVQAKYHTAPLGRDWSVAGFSTGALCASKLALGHPDKFAAAVAFGGEYEPYLDNTTGDLFHGDQQVRNRNSSRWLYTTYGMRGAHLLMVSSRQDSWAWQSTQAMATLTRGNSNVTLLDSPTGGHNFHTYAPYLAQSLSWLNAAKAFG